MKMRKLAFISIYISLCSAALSQQAMPFAGGSFDQILQAHKGRPTIIHFWGLTCGPCRAEMPAWGEILARRQDFDFLLVDTDVVPGQTEKAEAFLAASGLAKAENWRFADPFAEKLYFEVDPKWQGEIPMTIFIGKNGQSQMMTGSVDPATIGAWLNDQKTKP